MAGRKFDADGDDSSVVANCSQIRPFGQQLRGAGAGQPEAVAKSLGLHPWPMLWSPIVRNFDVSENGVAVVADA